MAVTVVALMVMVSLMSPFVRVRAFGPGFGEGGTFRNEVELEVNTGDILQCLVSRNNTLVLAAFKVSVTYFHLSEAQAAR